jgi:hypothetical protein
MHYLINKLISMKNNILSKKSIEELKRVCDESIYIKDNPYHTKAPIHELQGFFASFQINYEIKFENFKNYIRKYSFSRELKLLGFYNDTEFNYDYCNSFMVIIKYHSIRYDILYYESLVLPYGHISIYQHKKNNIYNFINKIRNLKDFDQQHDFIKYIMKFNNSLMYLDEKTVRAPVPNTSTELHEKGDVVLFNMLFKE